MKNLRNLTSPVFLILAVAAALGSWIACDSAAQSKCRELLARVTGDDAVKAPSQAENDAQRAEAYAAGNDFVRRARGRLLQRSAGLTANLLQIVQTPEQTYRGTGRFLQSADGKSRLEVEMDLDGVKGNVTQIANGQVIWFIQHVQLPPVRTQDQGEPEVPAESLSIERVDLRRVSQHAINAGLELSNPRIARELLGGWTGLLATLEAEMNFRVLKRARLQGEEFVVLEGVWKTSWEERNFENEFIADAARGAAPDKVRLYLRQRDLLPVRYVCLKRRPKRDGWFAPLALELTDIDEKSPVDPTVFNYRPEVDQVPNDVTHEYIARLEAAFPTQTAEQDASETAPETR